MYKVAFKASAKKLDSFPYESNLSFLPIIRHWEKVAKEGTREEQAYASTILEEIDKIPAFRKPIKNYRSFVRKNRSVLDKIMSAIFPKALEFNEIKAVTPPFKFDIISASPRFQKIIEDNGGALDLPYNIDPELVHYAKYIHASLILLAKYYNRYIPLETPFIFKMQDPATGLDMYYKMTINADFVEFKVKGELKKLSEQDINQMVENMSEVELWTKNLPPDNFEINGFVVSTLVNVTLNELLSLLKNNLLERDALLTETQFERIRHNVRSILKIPDLRVGLGVFNDRKGISNFGHWCWRDLICKGQIRDMQKEFKGSIYEKVLETGEVAIVEDIKKIRKPTGIEKAIENAGIKSLIVAPLKYSNEVIGYLELGSGTPKVLNTFSMARLNDILPLFSVAIQRSVEEQSNRIGAVITEKFTAIHSSVQWRFQRAAKNYLRAREQGQTEVEMEPIVFENVYPLYGMADIRDSSVHRNMAIQEDLITQLELAQKIVQKVRGFKQFPILDEINFRIEKLIASIGEKLRSQDEARVYRLFTREIEPFFNFIISEFPSVAEDVAGYKNALDPKLGVVYRRRKSYEQSVTRINQALSEFLEEKEKEAQEMCPHYFEKYKTDGIDYNIYVGESLLKEGIFNNICLSNIRLWQLIMMSEMTRVAAKLEPELPIPLSTAQLILVHDDPLSIRFRIDEKKFDVDGAYNMRYEIIKKRIDKALIKGTKERATQPGTITVVYTNPDIHREYMKYCEFLYHKNLVHKEIEQLALEDSQGVTDLKALRIRVKLDQVEKVGTDEIDEIISSLQE